MRAILVSGGLLALAGAFGLGVVVGRFVLSPDKPSVSAPDTAILGQPGLDNPIADPDAAVSGDASLNAPPPTIAAPLPPAVPPSAAPTQTVAVPRPTISPAAESEAAIAASKVTASCDLRVSRNAPVRNWNQKDRVSAIAVGPTCGTSTIRILLETSEGAALYSLQAPARDFGIEANDNADAIRDRLSQLLPTNAVRAAAYPAWPENGPAPTRSEFDRTAYEAIRAADAPVTCLKLPTGSQRCVAADLANGQIKVFSRG